MKYVIEVSGWGGYHETDEGLQPWRSAHSRIVEADSERTALDQVMGGSSSYPLLGTAWKVYELGPHLMTWKTKADTPFTPITAYQADTGNDDSHWSASWGRGC